jgi:hypothetical protein
MSVHEYLANPNTQAAAVTMTSSASAFTFWGLKIGDLGIMVSSLVAVCGLLIQIGLFIETRRHNRAREDINARDEPAYHGDDE